MPLLEREVLCTMEDKIGFHELQISSTLKHAVSDFVVLHSVYFNTGTEQSLCKNTITCHLLVLWSM